MSRSENRKEILLMVTGSIAAYKACQVVSRLAQAGHGVQVVASEAALRFVGAATWEGLSGRAVVSDLFEAGRAMDHIHLVRKADLILAAPASAHFINRIASGIGDDLMTTMFLAHDFKKPFLVAPAMNTSMYLHPATQASLQKLRAMGVGILEAASGVLACGETGYGRLLEPDLILQELNKVLGLVPATATGSASTSNSGSAAASPSKRARVLVTTGGTREPIDDVRAITNLSTGRSGQRLADDLAHLGHDVTLLKAKGAPAPAGEGIRVEIFESFADLEASLRALLSDGRFTHVIHLAAVSDYVVDKVLVDGASAQDRKIPSGRRLTLELKPTPKLISRFREWGGAGLRVAGFKLTSSATADEREQAARKVLAFADVVIGNDVSEISDRSHPYAWWTPSTHRPLTGFVEMSAALAEWIASTEGVHK